jgi:hypothetical protein
MKTIRELFNPVQKMHMRSSNIVTANNLTCPPQTILIYGASLANQPGEQETNRFLQDGL